MKRSTATRLAEAMEAMASHRSVWLKFGVKTPVFSTATMRHERDALLKAAVELRRLAAKPKKKQARGKA